MSIILIRPKNIIIPDGIISIQYPINLAYLAAWLKKNGINVVILDFEVEKFNANLLIDLIKDKKPILIGMSCMTSTITSGHSIAMFIKRNFPHIPIVAGGVHPTALPERTLREFSSFDIIIKGEGEETLLELYNSLREKRDIAKVKGLVYRSNDSYFIDTGPRALIHNLDILPFPDRDILNIDLYRKTHVTRGFSRLNRRISEILTARGCPYDCIFCASKVIFGKSVRYRTIDNIISEMEECITKYNTNHFSILDDTFTFRKDILYPICAYLKYKKVTWDCLTRVDKVDEEMISRMIDSGCKKISFGVESGSEKILKLIRKDITIIQIKKAFSICKKSGLNYLDTSFMLGNHPFETIEDIQSTLNLIVITEPDLIAISIAIPFPGTQLNHIMKENGYLKQENWDEFVLYGSRPSWKYEYLDIDALKRIQKEFAKKFYSRFPYIIRQLRKIKTVGELRYWLTIVINMLKELTVKRYNH